MSIRKTYFGALEKKLRFNKNSGFWNIESARADSQFCPSGFVKISHLQFLAFNLIHTFLLVISALFKALGSGFLTLETHLHYFLSLFTFLSQVLGSSELQGKIQPSFAIRIKEVLSG